MPVNNSTPDRGLSHAIRNLFRPRSSSSPTPTPSHRRRISLLIQHRRSGISNKYYPSLSQTRPEDVSGEIDTKTFASRDRADQARPSTGAGMIPTPPFDPATIIGLSEASQGTSDASFDIFSWYPHYQNCQRYFLDHAQHSIPVQALSAFLNIQLPFQRHPNPISNSSTPTSSAGQTPSASSPTSDRLPSVSLIPYIRRLVATGMDFPGVLHGFFGDDWGAGIGTLHEQERRNYLFAAKSGGWASVKKDYDMTPQETIPFLRPLQGPLDSEIEAAEKSWSEWLAMEDWMVGPRAPDALRDSSSQNSRPRSVRG